MSVYISLSFSICLCMLLCLCFCLLLSPSIWDSPSLSLTLSHSLSFYLCLSPYYSLCICLSVCLSVCLCLSPCHFLSVVACLSPCFSVSFSLPLSLCPPKSMRALSTSLLLPPPSLPHSFIRPNRSISRPRFIDCRQRKRFTGQRPVAPTVINGCGPCITRSSSSQR